MPSFTVDDTTDLFMREKLADFDGDSFIIKDAEDNEIMQVDGNGFSIRENKTLKDMDGNELYVINEELVNFDAREKQYIRDPDGEVLFTLRRAGLVLDRNTVNVYEGDTEEEDCLIYTIQGEFFEKEFDVKTLDEEQICEITRQRFANIITDKDTYAITVEAGQDAALMIAFAVAVDEIFRDD